MNETIKRALAVLYMERAAVKSFLKSGEGILSSAQVNLLLDRLIKLEEEIRRLEKIRQ